MIEKLPDDKYGRLKLNDYRERLNEVIESVNFLEAKEYERQVDLVKDGK